MSAKMEIFPVRSQPNAYPDSVNLIEIPPLYGEPGTDMALRVFSRVRSITVGMWSSRGDPCVWLGLGLGSIISGYRNSDHESFGFGAGLITAAILKLSTRKRS